MKEIKYKAIKYIRLSNSDDKNGESDSVSNQRKLLDKWLENHPEIEVYCEKIDDRVSGIIFDRPSFKEMLEEFQKGNANLCLCKDISRFGLESIETARYLRRILPAYGVRFVAINDNIDTLNDNAEDLTVSLKTIINDAYCRDISIKTRSALEIKRANGDYVGACPIYGYKKSAENHNKLEIDTATFDVVKTIFCKKLEGISSAKIADFLNENGILSPYQYKKSNALPCPKKGFADKENSLWSAQTIIRILQNETYTGTLIQGKISTPNYKLKELKNKPENEWKRTENAHSVIISKQDFDLVQQILKLDTRTSPENDKLYLFSGLIICGSCGNRMLRKTASKGDKKYFNYWCPTTKKGGCLHSAMIKESVLISCVLEFLKSHIANVVSLETVISETQAYKLGEKIAAELRVKVSENSAKIEKLKDFKNRLYENLLSDIITKENYKILKTKYADDIKILEIENENLQKEITSALSCDGEKTA